MPITTRKEIKRRRLDALAKLNTSWGVGDTISYLVRDYKITRRSANLDVACASTELCKNFDNTENTDMLAWLLTKIQRVAVKSEEDKQYGAAVGCYRNQEEEYPRKKNTNLLKPVLKGEKSTETLSVLTCSSDLKN